MNRVVIVGPGAIGCYLAAALSRNPEASVALLDHRPERAARLRRTGVHLVTPTGTRHVPLQISHRPEAALADTVILCVKAFDTDSALRHSEALFGADTLVVSLQNGHGNVERVAEHADPSRVIAATTTAAAYLEEPDRVVLSNEGDIRLAPLVESGMPRVQAFVALLAEAGLRMKLLANAHTLVWSKLVVNAAINPVTALAGVTNGQLLERPDLMAMALAAAREAETVAGTKGIRLAYADAEEEVRRVCRETAGNRSSMLEDLDRNRRTEVEQINGAIAREAKPLGIPTPVNAQLRSKIAARHPRVT